MKQTFRNGFESCRWIAQQNEAWFDEATALRLWRKAREEATTDTQRTEADANIKRLEAEELRP